MNCYSGLAKRLIKSCFPRIIPVTQLEPLDAKNIIKQDVTDISAKEREAKEETLTDTDESYDSDDSEFGVPTHPVRNSTLFAGSDNEDTVEQLVKSIIAQWVTALKKWPAASTIQAVVRGRLVRSGAYKLFDTSDFYNAYYMRKAVEVRQCWWVTTYTLSRTAAAMATLWNVEKRAATIIQATARGRAVRAWNPFVSVTMALQTDTNGLAFVARFVAREVVVMVARMFGRKISAVTLNAEASKLEADARARRVVGPVMAVVKRVAATIIQATERGRALRAWNAQFTDGLAH